MEEGVAMGLVWNLGSALGDMERDNQHVVFTHRVVRDFVDQTTRTRGFTAEQQIYRYDHIYM
jgi:hypothetical protein